MKDNYLMRDKLIGLLLNSTPLHERDLDDDLADGEIESVADHLIANNVFVLPDEVKYNLELFLMDLYLNSEEEIEETKEISEFSQKKKILTDIRDYLLRGKSVFEKTTDFESVLFGAGVQVFIDQALADLTEYAEKLGVEL